MQHRPLNCTQAIEAWPHFDPHHFLDQNAGFIRISSRDAWVVFTRSPIPLKIGTSSLWAVRVNDALKPVGVPQKLVEHGGDARAICHSGRVLVFFTTYQRNANDVIDGSGVSLAEFSVLGDAWVCLRIFQLPKHPINGGTSTGANVGWEKNWVPFLDANSEIGIIYSHDPWNVMTLKFAPESLPRLDNLYISPSVKWDFGVIRGGTPPLRYKDDCLITFFHSSQFTGSKNIYSCGACVFMDKPPYSPLAFTPNPLLMAPYKDGLHRFGWPYAISVVFLNGADRIGEQYRLFGGRDDGELMEYTVSIAELEARLTPVAPEGGGRLLDYRGKETRVELERTLFMPDGAHNSEELPMVHFLKALLGYGRRFVDVGAYIGLYTMGLAPRFERILAFEPSRFSYPWLRRNIAVNGYQHVVAEQVALSDHMGEQMLYMSGQDGYADTLAPCHLDGYRVPTQTLDSYALHDVDLIKMDVQGYEMAVLDGARQTIAASRPVILIDVCDQAKRPIVQSALSEMGYSCDFMFPLTPNLALCLARERRHEFEWFI